jgi:nicotinamidase-related amidase
MSHLEGALGQLYALAEQQSWPVAFTTCCSGRMLRPGDRPEVLHIPMDAADTAWQAQLDDYRIFYLEKPAYGDPKINFAKCAFEIFARNANADALVQRLGVRHWVVFGNGLDLCVNGVVEGLLRSGVRVTVIADVLVSSATGDADTMREILAGYSRRGLDTPVLDDFLSRYR